MIRESLVFKHATVKLWNCLFIYFLVNSPLVIIIHEGKYYFLALFVLQVSDNQRVDPLGSWMDFVKRPVDNFPGKCRKRKRPLVNAVDAVCLAVFTPKNYAFLNFSVQIVCTTHISNILTVILESESLKDYNWTHMFSCIMIFRYNVWQHFCVLPPLAGPTWSSRSTWSTGTSWLSRGWSDPGGSSPGVQRDD